MLLYVLLNKLTVFLLHQSIHYFCWTQPFVWKALSYVALVLYSTSSRWKQQPKRSHVHSYSFPPKLSAHQRHWIMQIVFSCTSEHRKTHIWHERDSLSFVCGFSEKAAAPALLCLFAAWGLKPLPFRHPCHRCCLSNVSIKRRWDSGIFCPARCCKHSSHSRCLPLNSGIRPCPCRKSLYFHHLAAVNHLSCSSTSLAFHPSLTTPNHLLLRLFGVRHRTFQHDQHIWVQKTKSWWFVRTILCWKSVTHVCSTIVEHKKRTVMLVVMFMQVKFVVKSHWSVGNITFIIIVV